jgi:hypothetical protein
MFAAGANPERDWRRFLMRVEPCPTTGCWLWTSYGDKDGYGFFYAAKKLNRAHRYIYERVTGEIPEGMVLDHVCRNRACVNPDHLRVVTPRENVFVGESAALAKRNKNATHCIRGHEFTPENTSIRTAANKRSCKKCAYTRQRITQGNATVEEIAAWQ